jgi:hypothetical protein
MKKLELKHLAPYLPYRLKSLFPDEEDISKEYEMELDMDNVEYFLTDAKPILRPLTPLQNFVVLTTEECLCVSSGLAHNIPQWKFEVLVENHFDVFGLIPAGLAIDINTITP